MTRRRPVGLEMVVLVACVFACACAVEPERFAEDEPEAFAPVGILSNGDAEGARASVLDNLLDDPAVTRYRFARVDIAALRDAGAIDLDLFPDVRVLAVKDRVELRADGFSWFGEVKGPRGGQAIFTVHGDNVAAQMLIGFDRYQIRPLGGGAHAVARIESDAYPDCSTPPDEEISIPFGFGAVADGFAADDGSVIDVMVVYNNAADLLIGDIEAHIQSAIDDANQAYVNSGISTSLNLVHTELVAYTPSGSLCTDRTRLAVTNDGNMDGIHALRDAYNADLVALLSVSVSSCGCAYIMTDVSTASDVIGFSAVDVNCAVGNHSFAHELGHNQSMRHDWYVDWTNNSPYAYNHGYANVADEWRTVMAYNDACTDASKSCVRLPYFSNPAVLRDGDPMGVLIGEAGAADNHTVLENTKWTVANFRVAETTTTTTTEPTTTTAEPTTTTAEPTTTSTTTTTATTTSTTTTTQPPCYDDTLQVDDGSMEQSLPFAGGQTLWALNCLAPDQYPATISTLRAFVPPANTGTLSWVVWRDTDGEGPPDGTLADWTSAEFTPNLNAWNEYDLSGEPEFDIPINAGSWCVGFKLVTTQSKAVAQDTSSVSAERSWFGAPGFWNTIDGWGFPGNFLMRADVEICPSSTTTTTMTSTTTTTGGGSTTTTTQGSTTTTVTTASTTTTTSPSDDDTDDDADDDVDDDTTDDDTTDDDATDDDVSDDDVLPDDDAGADQDDDATGDLGDERTKDNDVSCCGC